MLDQVQEYFNAVNQTFAHNLMNREKAKCPVDCSMPVADEILEATMPMRDPDVPIFLVEREYLRDHIALHQNTVGPDEKIHSQLLVKDGAHYYLMDMMLERGNNQCLFLDAAGDDRAGLTAFKVGDMFEKVYVPLAVDSSASDAVFDKVHHDFHSCIFYSVQQGAELSHMNVYDYLATVECEDMDVALSPKWDDLPPQVLMYAQRSEATMQKAQAKIATQPQAALDAGYLSAEEFGQRYQQHIVPQASGGYNHGICHFANQVHDRIHDNLQARAEAEAARQARAAAQAARLNARFSAKPQVPSKPKSQSSAPKQSQGTQKKMRSKSSARRRRHTRSPEDITRVNRQQYKSTLESLKNDEKSEKIAENNERQAFKHN